MKKSVIVCMAMLLAVSGAMAIPAFADEGQPPIKVGPVAIVGVDDIGTCNNVWAQDSFDKFYTLTLNRDGTYNLQVNYKDGTFVTNAGVSPGACESGTNNGNTVAAGITGKMHEEWNITVTATVPPNPNPDCGTNNVGCPKVTSFLTAVFGSTGYAQPTYPTDYSYTGHYQAGSNGVWFDTDVNWPLNDRGDITGT
jgi:hypothetical protein